MGLPDIEIFIGNSTGVSPLISEIILSSNFPQTLL